MKNLILSYCSGKRQFTKKSRIEEYKEKVKELHDVGLSWNLTEREINCVLEKSVHTFLTQSHSSPRGLDLLRTKLKKIIRAIVFCLHVLVKAVCVTFAIFLALYVLLQHKRTQYFVQSKLQDFIYPGMKMLRKLSLPVISMYPSITDLYDENCLVSNPFFRVSDLPCPCENVRAILNLTGEDTSKEEYHSGIPYIMQINREEVSRAHLNELYKNYSDVFDHHANHITISSFGSDSTSRSAQSFFSSSWSANDSTKAYSHIIWRSNRMEPTRLLRRLFGMPVGEPNYAAGVIIEKFIIIDGPKALLHHMPTTDGTTVFIQQSSGSRMVVLTPAHECSLKCTPISVLLPPSHIFPGLSGWPSNTLEICLGFTSKDIYVVNGLNYTAADYTKTLPSSVCKIM